MFKSKVVSDSKLDQTQIVRRYLDLPKYLELLRTRSLYLRRVDLFSDRFEGAIPPLMRQAMDDQYVYDLAKLNADQFWERTRKGNYLSCWNMDAKDNMALWQLYGGASASVAITTTVEKLMGVTCRWEREAVINKVSYVDHFKNPDMVIGKYPDLLKFKHLAYAYERELRIIVPQQVNDLSTNPDALHLPIDDLNDFIRSVVVAPEAGPWFYDLIKDVTGKYGLTSPVRRSKLTYLPLDGNYPSTEVEADTHDI